jgi:hypothetical protein
MQGMRQRSLAAEVAMGSVLESESHGRSSWLRAWSTGRQEECVFVRMELVVRGVGAAPPKSYKIPCNSCV